MKNKNAQVTIFIIIAILIVVTVITTIYFMKKTDTVESASINPKALVDKCVQGLVEDSIKKMLLNGGEAAPSQYINYQGEEYNYLCYQADYYLNCYNIHPMLERQIEGEIYEDTKVGVQNCFNSMRQELENQGFTLSGGETTYSVNLLPGYAAINLQKRISITSPSGGSQNFNDFNTRVMSPIYDLILVAREIINAESQFCNFEYNGYMLLYPQYDIRRIDYSDSKIYRLIDRKSKEELKFAVRSCAFAPGI